ncbi:hypothetical protein GCM10008929_13630 [Alkalibacterium psychrotolerans]
MVKIGVLLIDYLEEKESLTVAKKVYPYLRKIDRRNIGIDFEIIRSASLLSSNQDAIALTEEGKRELEEINGFIFIVPTFSEEVPEEYQKLMQAMTDQLVNKSVLIMCYGKERDRKNTKRKMNEALLDYDVGLPTSDIFFPEYGFMEWNKKAVIEEYVTSRVIEYLYWTMGMNYIRNLKKSLVI